MDADYNCIENLANCLGIFIAFCCKALSNMLYLNFFSILYAFWSSFSALYPDKKNKNAYFKYSSMNIICDSSSSNEKLDYLVSSIDFTLFFRSSEQLLA